MCFQLKETALCESKTAVRSSSTSGSSYLSKYVPSASHSPRSSHTHNRHVHWAGYQQLMDIINLPRRSAASQPSTVLKATNHGLETASVGVASDPAVGRSVPRSSDGSQRDETLKPTDILVQFVDTL